MPVKHYTAEAVISEIRDVLNTYRRVVISGEVGVGKITNTLEALREAEHVYYISNPVDYAGKPRPQDYYNYINFLTSIKKDLYLIESEEALLSCDIKSLSAKEAIVVIDEIYGRSPRQYEKIVELLGSEKIRVALIAGCLKNTAKIIQHFDTAVMYTKDSVILVDIEFIKKVCRILGAESFRTTP